MQKILVIIFCMFLLVGTVSASNWDNTMSYDKHEDKITFKNKIFLETIAEATLLENECINGRYCHATKEITLYKKAILIENFKTLRIDDDSWDEQDIRWHKLEYWGDINEFELECKDAGVLENGTVQQDCKNVKAGSHKGWIEFKEGDEFKKGTYKVKTSGEIKHGRTYDWQVEINGDWTTPWSVWGNISLGDDAEVTLNSPADDTIVFSNLVTFNASANVTGGAFLTNMSLWTNITGSWEINETIDLEFIGGIPDLLSYYKLDETTGTTAYDVISYNNATNDGVIINVSGIIETAYDFEVSDNKKVEIPSSLGAGLSNQDITMNWWFKPEQVPTGVSAGNFFDLNGDERLQIRWANGTLEANGPVVISQAVDMSSGEWYMITYIANSTGAELFINGSSVATNSGDARINFGSSATGNIGADYTNSPGRGADGVIDELGFYTRSLTNDEILNLYNSGIGERPYGLSSSTQTFSKIITDDIIWNVQSCDSDGDCGFAIENRTVLLDLIAPVLNITYPTEIVSYGNVDINETLNFTVSDTNLDSCWYDYANTNVTLNCSENTTFTIQPEYLNMTLWANDTLGNLNSYFKAWDYKVFQNSFTFNNETTSGTQEDFILNLTLGSGYELTTANFSYNGTTVSPSIFSSGQQRIIAIEDYEIPLYITDTNATIYFDLLLDDTTLIQTTPENQSVSAIFLDNCAVYTNMLFNVSLYEEKTKSLLDGTIEFNYHLLNQPSFTEIGSINFSVTGESNLQICSETNLSEGNYVQSIEVRYLSTGFEPEFYNIQKAIITPATTQLNLYDLNITQSTRFKITYQNSDFVFVEGAIVQLQRKYIAENIYEVVESPITSAGGVAVLHIDLDTIKYKATIVKDGVLLDTFDNIVFECASELTGECEQKLLGKIDPGNDIPLDKGRDFSYTVSEVDNIVSVTFSIPSGSPSNVNMQLTQTDQFGNSSLCNQTVISSGGSIECEYDDTIGDSYLDLRITKDSNPIAFKTYLIAETGGVDFLNNNYFIVIILLLSLVGMAISSPEFIVINGIVTMVIAGSLFLLNGLGFVTGFGGLLWLLVAGIILIYKMSKQEDR